MKLEAVTLRSTRALQPAATLVAVGTLYFVTDESVLERSNGTAWEDYSPAGGGTGFLNYSFTAPVLGDFTWVNQGVATGVTSEGGILMSTPGIAGDQHRLLVQTAPATPYTITIATVPLFNQVNYMHVGLVWRQSSDGKLVNMSVGYNTGVLGWETHKFSSPTAYVATYTTASRAAYPLNNGVLQFLRIADNGTNRICSFSSNGFNWITLHTVLRTDYLTADQVGLIVGANNASSINAATQHVLSWKVG